MKNWIAGLVLVLTATGCGSSTPSSPSTTTGTIVYSITGTAKHVFVTYQTPGGGSSQTGAAVPWTMTFSGKSGDFLYVSGQIDTSPDAGAITVAIIKNGTTIQSGTANGFPAIATASTTF